MVLGPNEYANILDETKGNVSVYVGPVKTSLSNTDRPVLFDRNTGSFKRCSLEEATLIFPTAPEGYYIILLNPAIKEEEDHPKNGISNISTTLEIGRKINITGPVSFPLWPGQVATILQGHRLRSNQYLVVQVYNDESAREHWDKAVVRPQIEGGVERHADVGVDSSHLTMGQQIVIKGTDVSFYIPPTGLKVVKDNKGSYIREAVTLERLEYCILLDEDGNKRFVQGPAVVFPEPTEQFVETNGMKKFRAVELNDNMGIYVKVIEDHDDRKAGDELFITGKEQRIYFPRKEHAIVKYGDEDMHFAAAIPEGEARYVLDKTNGSVGLEKGPQMYLPDPRAQVVVRRVLDPRTVDLWFPGNVEAKQHNKRLEEISRELADGEVLSDEAMSFKSSRSKRTVAMDAVSAGDEFERRKKYTPPRTITLDTKYDGAVAIGVWTGYAVQIVGKTGERRVVVGPQTILLKYDETLEVLAMSTGTPKTDDRLIRTVYLLVQNNKVSDMIEAETRDLVEVRITVSYRVNFDGTEDMWFGVENYVKLLTDHCRSMIRNIVKQSGIEQFNDNAINIVRDTILGVQGEDGKRPGRGFDENGMRIYDVEVLGVEIGDDRIESMLASAQHDAVKQAVDVVRQERTLEATKKSEAIDQEIARLKSATTIEALQLLVLESAQQSQLDIAVVDNEFAAARERLDKQMEQREVEDKVAEAAIARQKMGSDYDLTVEKAELEILRERIQAETEGIKERAGAISPDLIASMQNFADKALVERLAESMGPLAILGGRSIADVASRLLKGTSLENVMKDGHLLSEGRGKTKQRASE